MGLVSTAMSAKGISYLALFGLILYAVHIIVILSLGKYFRIPVPDILLASNANIGNHATASALAVSKGWEQKVLPAILVGTFGNSIGTFLGIWFGTSVLRSINW